MVFGKLMEKYKLNQNDTGSLEIQVISMTEKINSLIEHFKINKFDFGSKRGLTKLVSRRRKFLDYLKKHKEPIYKTLIEDLKLRK